MSMLLSKLKISQYPIDESINSIILKVSTILNFGDRSKTEENSKQEKNILIINQKEL